MDPIRRTHAILLSALYLSVLAPLPHAQGGIQNLGQVQREHRSLFDRYKEKHSRNLRDGDLSDLSPGGEPVRIVLAPPQGELDLSGRTTGEYLREYGCAADAVVVAVPRAGRSDFMPEGTFIVTYYDADIEIVIRGETVLPGSQIRVLWPGGALMHRGRRVSTVDQSYSLLSSGSKYLLFLRQISQGEFEAIPETAGYALSDPQARSLGAGALRESITADRLVSVAMASMGPCDRDGR